MPTDVIIGSARPAGVEPPGLPGVVTVLRMLADPVRAAILERLSTEQLCVCHLQEVLGAKQTLMSHHLKALRDAGLVETEPAGRFTYYRLRAGAFEGVHDAVQGLVAASGRELPKRPC
jgi:ArsR family transcriptional regulator, arsenate/arsenite/antimonite-responsive transcriptional repressor